MERAWPSAIYTYAGLRDSDPGTKVSLYQYTSRDGGSQEWGRLEVLDIPSLVREGENPLGLPLYIHTHT